jgi:hypothetical protein
MSFKSGHLEIGVVDLKQDLPTLSIGELYFLLSFIGESKFKGKDVEKVYALSLNLNNILQYQLEINRKEEENKPSN